MPTDADPPSAPGHSWPGGPAGRDQRPAVGGDPAGDGWTGRGEEPAVASLGERLAGWVRPTPGELVGLVLLVLGSVVATLLWWGQSVTGPAALDGVLAGGAAVAADGSTDGPAPGIGTGPPVEQVPGEGAVSGRGAVNVGA